MLTADKRDVVDRRRRRLAVGQPRHLFLHLVHEDPEPVEAAVQRERVGVRVHELGHGVDLALRLLARRLALLRGRRRQRLRVLLRIQVRLEVEVREQRAHARVRQRDRQRLAERLQRDGAGRRCAGCCRRRGLSRRGVGRHRVARRCYGLNKARRFGGLQMATLVGLRRCSRRRRRGRRCRCSCGGGSWRSGFGLPGLLGSGGRGCGGNRHRQWDRRRRWWRWRRTAFRGDGGGGRRERVLAKLLERLPLGREERHGGGRRAERRVWLSALLHKWEGK